MRVLQTALLTLEPQLASHAPEMFALLADPAIYAHENEPPVSVAWLRERFCKLESRQSPNGQQQWLNWVIRLPTHELAGYVQATVHPDGRAAIAYVLASRYWARGLASAAVRAMIDELHHSWQVSALSAVLKRGNIRSLRLLQRLGFELADEASREALRVPADELLMLRDAAPPTALHPGPQIA